MSEKRKPVARAHPVDISTRANAHSGVEKIRERMRAENQAVIHDLTDRVVALKKFLKSKGIPLEAARELDEFVMDVQDRWGVAAEAIEALLEVE